MRRDPDDSIKPTKKKRKPSPVPRASTADKQAAVWAAKHELKPWEIEPPKPPKPRVPVSVVSKPPPSLNKQYRIAKQTLVPGRVGERAKKQLARSMTPLEKAQHAQMYTPRDPRIPPWAGPGAGRDTSFLHALTGTGRSVYRTNRAIGEGLVDWAN